MKRQFVPLEKLSKRKRKLYHAARRGSWGTVNPVTKKSPNPRAYKRKIRENGTDANRISRIFLRRGGLGLLR